MKIAYLIPLLCLGALAARADVGDGYQGPSPNQYQYQYRYQAPPQYYCPPTLPWWTVFIPVPQISFYPGYYGYGYGGYGYGHGYYGHGYYGHGYGHGGGYHGGWAHGGGYGYHH